MLQTIVDYDQDTINRMVNKTSLVPINLDSVSIVKAVLSSDQPDSFRTIMGKSTLDNYARKINEDGIPLIVGHDTSRLPVGRVFQAEVKAGKLEAMFFLPKVGNENILRDISMGVISDMSMGASLTEDSDVTCSKCNKSIRRSECRHTVGKKYDGKTVYGVIENASANEASLVYKASNPSAQILSIVRMHNEDISNMDWNVIFTRIGKKPDVLDFSDDDNVGFLADQIVELNRQLVEHKSLADVGKQYRTDLIEDAKKERIRALGPDGWSVDNYTRMLGNADLETIKSEIAVYTEQANRAFAGGTRPTEQIRVEMVKKNEKLTPDKVETKPRKLRDSSDASYR